MVIFLKKWHWSRLFKNQHKVWFAFLDSPLALYGEVICIISDILVQKMLDNYTISLAEIAFEQE